MIPEAFVSVFGAGFSWLIGNLPATGTVTFDSFGPFVGLIKVFDTMLPVHEALAGVAALLVARTSIFGVNLIEKIYKLIPFKGT